MGSGSNTLFLKLTVKRKIGCSWSSTWEDWLRGTIHYVYILSANHVLNELFTRMNYVYAWRKNGTIFFKPISFSEHQTLRIGAGRCYRRKGNRVVPGNERGGSGRHRHKAEGLHLWSRQTILVMAKGRSLAGKPRSSPGIGSRNRAGWLQWKKTDEYDQAE